MRRAVVVVCGVVALTVGLVVLAGQSGHRTGGALAAVATGCPAFQSAPNSTQAFCETFDNPTVNQGGRAGQLNGVLWGTSMVTGSAGNPIATVPAPCGGAGTVAYPQNIAICNGQLVETTNDAGGVSSLAMYPRQPFDFAGRTGTVEFDVSNDTGGSHAAWPEFWITDQPVPDPFAHENSWQQFPRNGLGIRFAGCTDSTGGANTCTQGQNAAGVDSAVTISNYVPNDSFNGGSLKVVGTGSVLHSGPDQMNHYEIRVSTSQVDVYGTNPFSGTWDPAADPLIHIATIPVNLTFTRGVVWLEDVHYNGDKFGNQREHTFRWDNLAFDGPVLPRDLGVEVANPSTPNSNIGGSGVPGVDTAFIAPAGGAVSVTVPGVAGIDQAQAALLEYNFYPEGSNPTSLNVTVNGNPLSVAWPYPDGVVDSPRTIAIPVPLTDLNTGDNTVVFHAGSQQLDVFNVDLILAGAGGGGAPTTTTTAPATTTTTVPATTTTVAPTTTVASTTTTTTVPETTTTTSPGSVPISGVPCVVELQTLELGQCSGSFQTEVGEG
jgi:hypothetical protein